MKKTIGIILLCFGLAGCSTATYTGQDGVTVKYTRFLAGADSIKVALGDKPSAEINKQTVDTELLKSVLGLILGAAK